MGSNWRAGKNDSRVGEQSYSLDRTESRIKSIEQELIEIVGVCGGGFAMEIVLDAEANRP